MGEGQTGYNKQQGHDTAHRHYREWIPQIFPRATTCPSGVLPVLRTPIHSQWRHPLQELHSHTQGCH